MVKLIKQKNALSKKQMDIMKSTPFYNFFRVFFEEKIMMKECKKHQHNLDSLYKCYSVVEDAFLFSTEKMKVTATDISLIFSLPLKGINIEPT